MDYSLEDRVKRLEADQFGCLSMLLMVLLSWMLALILVTLLSGAIQRHVCQIEAKTVLVQPVNPNEHKILDMFEFDCHGRDKEAK